ncbi:MAG: DUF4426 domain-containing protein [Gammaproteobacteria bacterium]|nr:DUF4426 domain-containing protein [Gammaproteobacteria bacterium]MDH4314234.1 DUF4426 domain-containing protein [Gammaproteobacteria bacterium]MDH5213265.1 DUF4426 domain-containing protein [Gammaproteobacteria bacterium]
MNFSRIIITLSCLSMLASCGGPGENATVPEAQPAGASSSQIGNHVVHFSAQLTDQLPPEVARAYNILRSKNRAMLNVSILEATSGKPVSGTVTVKTVNLTGQLKNVVMRKIQEQEAIYYIGETPVANQETLIFDISVIPEGETEASSVRFKRQFYTN